MRLPDSSHIPDEYFDGSDYEFNRLAWIDMLQQSVEDLEEVEKKRIDAMRLPGFREHFSIQVDNPTELPDSILDELEEFFELVEVLEFEVGQVSERPADFFRTLLN